MHSRRTANEHRTNTVRIVAPVNSVAARSIATSLIGIWLLAVGVALLGIRPAEAVILTLDPDCANAVEVFNPLYDNCSGAYQLERGELDVTDGAIDNIATQILNTSGFFGQGGWEFLGKQDDESVSSFFEITNLGQTEGNLTFHEGALNVAFGSTFLTNYALAVSFKSGQNFSIYQWNAPVWQIGEDPVIGWTTAGTATNDRDSIQTLSHASVYYREEIGSYPSGGILVALPSSVPEPTTLALMALGMAGIGFTRKKAA
jgi:hypothetical protein